MARRVVHYLNQFFAGIGGEAAAGTPVEVRRGPVGPGRVLAQALGADATVDATIVCGDNYWNDERDAATARVRDALRELRPDVVVAGPAFEAGRYGVACAEVARVAEADGFRAVTGMSPDNPGVTLHGRDVLIVPTGKSPAEMQAALGRMARLALKLARGEALGPAEVEGYLPRGVRASGRRDRPGYARAIDMLVAKLGGRPFTSEVPYQAPESVKPAPPIRDLSKVTIAIITTGGLVPKGNPDRQLAGNAQQWFKYPVSELDRMETGKWEAIHAGYFTHIVDANPDYVLPLGFLRELERERAIGGVVPYAYMLPGVSTPVATSRRLGLGIAEDLRKLHAGGVVMVST
jgi:glycine reductase complex component B subunit gamma